MIPATSYIPASCELHSQLELAAIRRTQVSLEIWEPGTPRHSTRGLVLDIRIRDGAEWVLLQCNGKERSIRLDWLISMTDVIAD